MMMFFTFQALVLCGLLYLIARHEADYEYPTVMLTTVGITAGNFMLGVLLFPKISFFVLPLIFLFTWWMLMKFCWVPWHKGLLVTFLFFAITIAYQIGKAYLVTGKFALTSPYGNSADIADTTPQRDYERQMKEGEEVLADLHESVERMNPQETATNVVIPPTPATSGDIVAVAPMSMGRAAETNVESPARPERVPTPGQSQRASPQIVADIKVDWPKSKSQLRIRGWMDDKANGRTAMVNEQFVPVNGIASVDYNGLRYRWRLAALDNFALRWEPVDVAQVPASK